jgi:hypothetical protein
MAEDGEVDRAAVHVDDDMSDLTRLERARAAGPLARA